MAKIVGLPKLSPTMEEGTLSKWVKQEGDDIAVDDVIAEVETDKATMEWRSFDRGVLLKILAPEGATVAAEAPIAIVGQRGEDISQLLPSSASAGAAESPPPVAQAPTAPLTPQVTAPAAPPQEAAPPPAHAQREPAHPPRQTNNPQGTAGDGGAVRILASPSVRRLAREQSLDLRGKEGSGPGGRIIQRDLEGLLRSSTRAAPVEAAATMVGGNVNIDTLGGRPAPQVVPLSAMRRTIARRLVESKQTVPHFYLTADVRADALLAIRQTLNQRLEARGEKLSLNDLLIRACASALRRVPAVNASFMNDSIWLHQVVDISVAVALPEGLVTPVVRDADKKGLLEISREVRDLANSARQKKLKPEQMTGGTFSISNLGMYGIDEFQAVINPPEGAILAVGTVREVPTFSEGSVRAENRVRLTLSCDHRVIDGAVGAQWLAALRELVESPMELLL